MKNLIVKVILNAAGWHEKGVLTEDDLAEISVAIEAQKPATDTDESEA